ncbi:hypothetical protein CHELA20_40179 [Hyphomicrobiales bacterium]|nr:hypothetical protein CHELA20_40179 [Hyphomicrobiales bacterium]CAH1686927.1 hypothetical protein CHELA41_30054 [Hyphomicrobiales bacterium]
MFRDQFRMGLALKSTNTRPAGGPGALVSRGCSGRITGALQRRLEIGARAQRGDLDLPGVRIDGHLGLCVNALDSLGHAAGAAAAGHILDVELHENLLLSLMPIQMAVSSVGRSRGESTFFGP